MSFKVIQGQTIIRVVKTGKSESLWKASICAELIVLSISYCKENVNSYYAYFSYMNS